MKIQKKKKNSNPQERQIWFIYEFKKNIQIRFEHKINTIKSYPEKQWDGEKTDRK